MKKVFVIIIIIILSNCSFDNKSGIWDSNTKTKKKVEQFKDFKTLRIEEKLFDQIIDPEKNLIIDFKPIKKNLVWLNKNYNNSNNLDNFSYKNLNEIIFKSKKLTNRPTNENILFDGDKIITVNDRGDIIVFSLSNKNITFKYNFYKKKFKNVDKKLNITIDDNLLYVSDNIGYLYALDYKEKKLLWAKDFKVPFRSNLKVFDNKIVIADTNNVLYLVNKFNGEQLRSVPTEENPLKSNFSNSLVFNNQSLFYLNTYGSIYSTNYNGDLRWFININRSTNLKTNNLFYSNPVILFKNKLIISTDTSLYVLNANNGTLINKIAINSIVKPLISGKHLFLITKENLLVSIDLNSGSIIYSLNIGSQIANFLKTKKKSIDVKTIFIANNELHLFLKNSYLVRFTSKGNVTDIKKFPSKLNSFPIFINDSILYLDNKNRLIILD